MRFGKKSDVCAQARRNLADFYSERTETIAEISQIQERMMLVSGELSEAQNLLSRVEDAIQSVGDGVVAVGVDVLLRDLFGVFRDGLDAAFKLSHLEADQRQKISELFNQLEKDKEKLERAQIGLSIIERDIGQAIDFMRENDCRMRGYFRNWWSQAGSNR